MLSTIENFRYHSSYIGPSVDVSEDDVIAKYIGLKGPLASLDSTLMVEMDDLVLEDVVEWGAKRVLPTQSRIRAYVDLVGLIMWKIIVWKSMLALLKKAVNTPGSYEHASFYNIIHNCFVEARLSPRSSIGS